MVCRKQLAPGGRNLDADFVVRRNQRRPGLRQIRLARNREHKPIDHGVDHLGIRPVIRHRIWIVRDENDRRSRRWRRRLRHSSGNGAEENNSYVSDWQGVSSGNGLYE